MGWLADETGLEKGPANFVPLTPLSHLRRAADIFADRTAVVYGTQRHSYAAYHERVSRLASALAGRGIRPGDVVATILPNVPAHAEAHFGVPACGAILNAINTRLDVETVAYIFGHAGAKIVLCDSAHLKLAEDAIRAIEGPAPQIIEVADSVAGIGPSGHYVEYDSFWPRAIRRRPGSCPRTSGKALPSTTPRAPRGGPRAWSTTIAAPTLPPRPMPSPGGWCSTRST